MFVRIAKKYLQSIKILKNIEKVANMATMKQKMAAAKLLENHGNVSKTMRETGYTDNTAKNPKNLTESKGFKEATEDLVRRMEEARDRAIGLLTSKEEKADYNAIMNGVDKLTRNIQLLQGKPTEISKTSVEEVKERLKNLKK